MSVRASYQKIPNIRLGKKKNGETRILPVTPVRRVFPTIPSTPVHIPKPANRPVLKLKI